ncbi:putative TRAFAC class dynamin-like GTPase superfamily, dynamin Fzo YdjA family protein [Lyophyllum shimeji]|uniref:TRAFAC class dynamin-like GTPase superfamily, dynamin Fzo YdjA family protein n=1 Tax=Lyophyllum shimeji TaxID=47721 RepID=A0A9P3ULU8_LYOSH|nr:putative TRAFAC class dynamin-like GTPase superfamily, dynamin Fzo YdjA family protein [Lyophyllum shimeji]
MHFFASGVDTNLAFYLFQLHWTPHRSVSKGPYSQVCRLPPLVGDRGAYSSAFRVLQVILFVGPARGRRQVASGWPPVSACLLIREIDLSIPPILDVKSLRKIDRVIHRAWLSVAFHTQYRPNTPQAGTQLLSPSHTLYLPPPLTPTMGSITSDDDLSLPTTTSSDSTNLGSNHGVGLSNPLLSQSSRRMLDLVNRLHSTGVQVDIDLPQIAVIGSQSAGKSSLIESISGITLPRASGTCTRCPTECRLARSSDAWKCTVSLRIFEDGKVRNEPFGDVINKKSEVEERIKRAQWAILNPSLRETKGAKHFLTGDHHGIELSFSSNCVSLQISGPDVADLSFCDLPGLIAGVGMAGNASDIDLVKALVSSYIKRPSCIVLLTVACETDFQNQGAQELAKVYDPLGKRTIGVLTKPDRIPAGEEPHWIALIRNEKEPLDNGWYCVKQPSSAQLKAKITWAEARKSEDEFFASTAAWTELDSMYHKYLRTANLVERLSSILSDLISKRLPQIQDEIEKSIIITRDALNALPKPPSSDPQNEVANLLHKFVRDLSKHVEGVPEEGLLQSIRPAQERFRRAVRATAPDFQPFEKRHAKKKRIGKANFLQSEDGHEDFASSDSEEHARPSPNSSSRPNGASSTEIVLTGKEIYIDEVLDRANQARTRELPGIYPFVVQETFIKSIIKKWRNPAEELCRTVFHMLSAHVRQLVSVHFGAFGQGMLEQRVKVLLQDHLNKCLERTEERIEWLMLLEDRPFSLNTHYLADYKDKFLAHYRTAREKDRHPPLLSAIEAYRSKSPSPFGAPVGVAKVLASLVEMGIVGVEAEALAKLLEPDEMEPALNIMADVRAYFQVAYKRFADNIPLAIDYELIWGAERDVLQALNVGLCINTDEGRRICQELAQENPTVAGRRQELQKKLERMQAASKQLLQIGS